MKHLFQLVNRKEYLSFFFLNVVTGSMSFLFLTFVNFLTGELVSGRLEVFNVKYVAAFVLCIFVFIVSNRILAYQIVTFSQKIFWQLRREIIRLVLHADYQYFCKREEEIYATIVKDINVLTNASLSLIHFSTNIIIVLACLIYTVFISPVLGLITFLFVGVGVGVYLIRARSELKLFEKARELERRFMHYFNMIIDGFKEIQIDERKGKVIYSDRILPVGNDSIKLNTQAFTRFLNKQMLGQIILYSLVGASLLCFHQWYHISAGSIINYLFLVMFLRGAVETIMATLPAILQAKVSSARIMELKNDLETIKVPAVVMEEEKILPEFRQITFNNISFAYSGVDFGGIEIGPLNLNIHKGDLMFLYGNNGSGKTTFMYLLLGLLKPDTGTLLFNGRPLEKAEYVDYLCRFSVVFSDFYLFDEFYAIAAIDKEKLKYYLRLFEMDHKVSVVSNRFSTVDLSTGQRKRLAIIAALIEKKEILLLDEWAADQDPFFRKKFYTEIIPILKNEGITIIAITHDDKYYYCADSVYKMEFGKLSRDTGKISVTPLDTV